MNIPEGWYAIMSSDELTSFKPVGTRRLGRDLVLWRQDDDSPVAMLDICPHRSAKLSLGKVAENRIYCPFHGFEYDTTGSCVHVPETGKAAENLKVESFFLKERNGFIWLWHGKNDPVGEPPWFDEISTDSGLVYSQFTDSWPCHITRCIENQLDYAHLPFVHRSTIGRFVDVKKQAEADMDDDHIQVRPNPDKDPPSFIEFRFPNIWQNFIAENFMIFLAFVPVDEESTLLYLRSYYRGLNVPIFKDLVDWFFNITNGIILSQDKAVVVSQGKEASTDPVHAKERLFLSDIPIRHFRKTWLEKCSGEENR